jgi:hypothetical protein
MHVRNVKNDKPIKLRSENLPPSSGRWMTLINLMMEAVSTSETLVNFYATAWRSFSEDSHLLTRRLENLKSLPRKYKTRLS